GSTRWKRSGAMRAVEADACYLLAAESLDAWRHRSPSITESLSPDLAVEVDISPSAVDRAEIYATLRVSEVWRFDGAALVIDPPPPGRRPLRPGAPDPLPPNPAGRGPPRGARRV